MLRDNFLKQKKKAMLRAFERGRDTSGGGTLVFYQNGANLKVKHPKMYRMPKSIEKIFKLQKVRLSF